MAEVNVGPDILNGKSKVAEKRVVDARRLESKVLKVDKGDGLRLPGTEAWQIAQAKGYLEAEKYRPVKVIGEASSQERQIKSRGDEAKKQAKDAMRAEADLARWVSGKMKSEEMEAFDKKWGDLKLAEIKIKIQEDKNQAAEALRISDEAQKKFKGENRNRGWSKENRMKKQIENAAERKIAYGAQMLQELDAAMKSDKGLRAKDLARAHRYLPGHVHAEAHMMRNVNALDGLLKRRHPDKAAEYDKDKADFGAQIAERKKAVLEVKWDEPSDADLETFVSELIERQAFKKDASRRRMREVLLEKKDGGESYAMRIVKGERVAKAYEASFKEKMGNWKEMGDVAGEVLQLGYMSHITKEANRAMGQNLEKWLKTLKSSDYTLGDRITGGVNRVKEAVAGVLVMAGERANKFKEDAMNSLQASMESAKEAAGDAVYKGLQRLAESGGFDLTRRV